MEKFEARFKQVDVLPMVKHYMDELDLFKLFTKYVPAAAGSLADHAESLCILTANIILLSDKIRHMLRVLPKKRELKYGDVKKFLFI